MTPNALAKIQRDMQAARSAMVNVYAIRAHRHHRMAENMRDFAARAFLMGEYDAAAKYEQDAIHHDLAIERCVRQMLAEVGSAA
jgi:hypothetical protein